MPPRSFSLNSTRLPLLKLPTSARLPRSQCCRTSRRFDGAACGHLQVCSLCKQIPGSVVQQRRSRFHESPICTAFDEGAVDIPSLDDWGDLEGSGSYAYSSSDDEDSDGEFVINPVNDVDLPGISRVSNHDALTVTAHRFAMLGRRRQKRRSKYGALLNMGLITFLTGLLLLIDCCAWRIVRLPLESFYLTQPFFISMVLVSCAGYVCVPLLDVVFVDQIVQTEWPTNRSLKKRTPTMGGLFLVPIGVFVALFKVRFSSIEVMGAAMATLVYATVGFLDDSLSLSKNHYYGLSSRVKLLLEVAVGTIFSLWLEYINISSPYGMYTFLKALVPLPAPLGLICLGKLYMLLSSFGFVSMTNGVSSTDGLDGLAGGTAALSFTAMSIAVLPISPDLAIFGASMAGACVGFLLHNRYRASVFMGDTGSLALGGALASMAACTGMFFPLFISSGVFLLENLSVILQVSYFKVTKNVLKGPGRRLLRMAPFHSHLELCGFKEPIIVAGAYVVSALLSLLAAYVGLTSA